MHSEVGSTTGVAGLDKIIHGREFPPTQAQSGYRLLIQGLPGTGKTTLGLHLVCHQLAEKRNKGFIVYCQEPIAQLDAVAEQFDLDFGNNPPDRFRISLSEFKEGFPTIQKWIDDHREHSAKLCILIDGLSIVKAGMPGDAYRFLVDLTTAIPFTNLLLILIAEEDILGNDHSLEHLVDGVVNLSMDDGPERHRFLEITKLRYIDYVRGKHGLEMTEQPKSEKSCLTVFPRAASYFDSDEGIHMRQDCLVPSLAIESGIRGLERILQGTKDSAALQPGDVFLITAEPGTDKLGMGLSFLSPVVGNCEERGLWVSFGLWSIGTTLSREPHKTSYKSLRECSINRSIRYQLSCPKFAQINRSKTSTHPDSVICEMIRQLDCAVDVPTRIVVDGLSNIGWEFREPSRVVEYMLWTARILRKRNAISFIFIDLGSSFQAIGDIIMEWEAEADFIGHLRMVEINNQLMTSFVVSKSRYPHFRTFPHYLGDLSTDGKESRAVLEDRGWPMINMLSGHMDTIHEARVFLKFFDQNYSTRTVHAHVLEEFKRRYTDDQMFAHVYRTAPSPAHWSFRGYAGAGHSNTKVVCLRQYIMDVLEDDQCLVQLPEDEWKKYYLQTDARMPEKEYLDAKSYSLWGLGQRMKERKVVRDRTMIPLYADIGVMCCQINSEKLLLKAEREKGSDDSRFEFQDTVPKNPPSTWEQLFKLNESFLRYSEREQHVGANKVKYHPPWIKHLFALPSLTLDTSGLMAFFLEILVDFAELSKGSICEILKAGKLEQIIDSPAFGHTVDLLRRLVLEGVSASPLERIHYHTAYFSRRWYSSIDQYPQDDPKLPEIEKYIRPSSDPNFKKDDPTNLKDRFVFSINALPTNKCSSDSDVSYQGGYSCLEFYSLGIIRGALAPETAWMFISELAANQTDVSRFEQRRGLPILRENWAVPVENEQRKHDRGVVDTILGAEKYFCNFWIPKYWHIESKMHDLLRRVFLGIAGACGAPDAAAILGRIEPKVDVLQKDFISILREAGNKPYSGYSRKI